MICMPWAAVRIQHLGQPSLEIQKSAKLLVSQQPAVQLLLGWGCPKSRNEKQISNYARIKAQVQRGRVENLHKESSVPPSECIVLSIFCLYCHVLCVTLQHDMLE